MATKRDNEVASSLATIASLKETVASLKQMIASLGKTIAEQNKSRALLERMIAEQQKTIEKLTQELLSMNNKFNLFFGKKTEKQKRELPSDSPSPQSSKPPKKKAINGGGGRTAWPESLPRVDTIIDPPEEERICQHCRIPFRLIGQDIIEILRFVPMKLYVERIRRNKYIADCLCSDIRSVTAESPIRPIDKGMVGTDIIALMAVMKYADHLPLSRQATQIFKRSGIEFSESSMCRWMRIIADLLEPLYQLIHALILNSFFVMIDASCAKYRSLIMSGRCKQGYIWGFLGDNDYPYIWYGFEPNGKRAGPAGILGNYSGYVQCDAQNIYDRIFVPEDADMNDPKIIASLPTEVGCWAHARRKFHDAEKISPEATEMIKMIGVLYGVEKESREFDVECRHALRQKKSLPQLDCIFAKARDQVDKYTDKELIGNAYQYILNHEQPLRRYCEDGRLEIDNNACERALRPVSVGRKNWLFFGNERGGKTGVIIYSILQSAKRHGLNEYEYLFDILNRLADLSSEQALYDLLPDRWQKQN